MAIASVVNCFTISGGDSTTCRPAAFIDVSAFSFSERSVLRSLVWNSSESFISVFCVAASSFSNSFLVMTVAPIACEMCIEVMYLTLVYHCSASVESGEP